MRRRRLTEPLNARLLHDLGSDLCSHLPTSENTTRKMISSYFAETSRSPIRVNDGGLHTAIANAQANVEQRLARWILMAHDRVSGNVLLLTHEFLSLMLAVRRAGVTEALQSLSKQRLIKTATGEIVVLNRKGIERVAGALYGVPEAEYRRLI